MLTPLLFVKAMFLFAVLLLALWMLGEGAKRLLQDLDDMYHANDQI